MLENRYTVAKVAKKKDEGCSEEKMEATRRKERTLREEPRRTHDEASHNEGTVLRRYRWSASTAVFSTFITTVCMLNNYLCSF